MTSLRFLCVAALCACLAPDMLCAAASLPANQSQPVKVSQTPPAARQLVINTTLDKIHLPQGFKIDLFAIAPGARAIAVGPSGKFVFVGTTDENRVYAIETGKTFGEVVSVTEFAPSIRFTLPNGVCFDKDGTLYVAEQNRILSFANAETQVLSPSLVGEIVVAEGKLIPVSEQSRAHSARVCRVGPDGKLYVTLGQPYNVTPAAKVAMYQEIGMGGIIRLDRDGKNREVFATGIRNSVGLDFSPKDNVLWFTDNQVDGMGDDIPPEELNRAPKPGLNFGFPWYGGGHVRTNEFKADTPPADVVFPELELPAHAADLGMRFYTGTAFPEKYRGGVFIAQHGSWDRSVPIGARVVFVPFDADGHPGDMEVFVDGWLVPNENYLGRPVDVALMPDGSLLISDDRLGVIYRVTYEGG